ncbi:MAG: S41 family peptidase, partial [Flavitalea sp.]
DVGKLLQSFYKYLPADGYVTTEKQSGDLDNSFGVRYLLEYGLKDKYEVGYTLPGKTKRLNVTIPAVSFEQRQKNLDQKYSAKIDDLTDFKKQPTHSFEMTDQNTGLLNFRVFSMASGLDDPAFPGYVKFIDSVFVSLEQNKVANLIIDLRGNPGGADPMFEQPMMYLTDHTFRENDSAYTIFDDVPYEEYFWGITTDHKMSGDELTGGKQFLKSYFPKLINGRNDQESKHNPVYHPKQPRFKGKTYLLIDERVASAGSHLASLIKAYADNLTIVGVETCGGYLGHNGHMPMIYELPESKIKTKFSIVYVVQDAPPKPDQPVGRGIIPDHTVWQSYDDFIKQLDTQMEFTKQLIRKTK